MPAIAVTGGIACGKSTVASRLIETLGERRVDVAHFDADASAHNFLRDDSEIRRHVINAFGASILNADGTISRKILREIITRRPENRVTLEQILHPAIRAEWASRANLARHSKQWFVAEIPLLFETGTQTLFDRVITVACSVQSQLNRLSERSWSEDQIQQILIAQSPTSAKIQIAHHVIWTDVRMNIVGSQTALLAESLLQTFAECSDFVQPIR